MSQEINLTMADSELNEAIIELERLVDLLPVNLLSSIAESFPHLVIKLEELVDVGLDDTTAFRTGHYRIPLKPSKRLLKLLSALCALESDLCVSTN
jgi:hypothetical protein